MTYLVKHATGRGPVILYGHKKPIYFFKFCLKPFETFCRLRVNGSSVQFFKNYGAKPNWKDSVIIRRLHPSLRKEANIAGSGSVNVDRCIKDYACQPNYSSRLP